MCLTHFTYPLCAHWHIWSHYTASIFVCPMLLFLPTPKYSNQALFVYAQWSSSIFFLGLPTFRLPSRCHVKAVVHILVLSILRTWPIHPNFLFAILSLTLMYLFCGTSFDIFSGHVHVVLDCAFFELPMATVS